MSATYIPPPSLPLSGGTMTGAIQGNNGDAAHPGYAFANDATTGFFSGSAGVINASIAGVSYWTFNSNGYTQSIAGGGLSNYFLSGESGVTFFQTRYSANNSAPNFAIRKSRGTIASPSAISTNDNLGILSFNGRGSSVFVLGASIQSNCIDTTPSDTAMGSNIIGKMCAIGAAATTEVFRFDTASGFQMFGANPVIDANRVFRRRVFTVATLPTGADGMAAFVSDANATTFASTVVGGGTNHVPVYFEAGGSTWKIG